jgi:two-component system, chemotaxis family, protein-glutamate methylesterase/glutaminase
MHSLRIFFEYNSQNKDKRAKLKIIAIGSSTGGPGHLQKILKTITKESSACIIIAQHIGEQFLPSLIQNLANDCALPLHLASDRLTLAPSSVVFAKGDHINLVESSGGNLILRITDEKSDTYSPNIDRLFLSIAHVKSASAKSMGVLLTGIGDDGAKGLLAMKNAGAFTVAESEKTSIVYGMPRCAMEIGAASQILDIGDIAKAVEEFGRR